MLFVWVINIVKLIVALDMKVLHKCQPVKIVLFPSADDKFWYISTNQSSCQILFGLQFTLYHITDGLHIVMTFHSEILN